MLLIIRVLTPEVDDGEAMSLFIHSQTKEERAVVERIANTVRAELSAYSNIHILPFGAKVNGKIGKQKRTKEDT
jgi:hypothetical protein